MKKVMVVEDNDLNRKLFCDLLRAHDYIVRPVANGTEAIGEALSFRPDLIIMDIQLPGVNGMELIERIKMDTKLNSTPILAVTAYAGKGDEERIIAAGALGYIAKPITVQHFVDAVETTLKGGKV